MGLLDSRNQIIHEIEKGRSREDIFQGHIKTHPKEAAKMAYAIASIPQQEMRHKYLRYNAILFLLLLGVAILAVFAELPINPEESTLFIALKALVPLVFSYFVYQFHGGIYRLLGCWCLFDITELVLLAKFTTLAGLLKLLALFLAMALAWRIAVKVFPHLKILGPKQNEDGQYLL